MDSVRDKAVRLFFVCFAYFVVVDSSYVTFSIDERLEGVNGKKSNWRDPMKTKSIKIVLALLAVGLICGSALAAPQVTRKRYRRASRHPSPYGYPIPYGYWEQKGMRHYVAERGITYTVVNGSPVPAPASVIYTTPTPAYVGPTIITPGLYPRQPVVTYPTYWNYYAPPPPNPRPAVLYAPCIQPGASISLSF